ncbi:MAG TPA: DUF542 domain-containing protein [Chitinophagaceae bacterium]|jgi:regulator of cell morphogenesis and NO signaling|nr:DUF542 domain-containing protein [Chitinophagaceae bacterium]
MPLSLFTTEQTVSGIVRADYRTAEVFRRHGIHFCCGGQVSLSEACRLKGIEETRILSELEQATQNVLLSNNLRFDEWKIDFLIDYLINVHHAYLYAVLPALEGALISFADGHRKKFPEGGQVVEAFQSLSSLLLEHNREEEAILFPYIKQIGNAFQRRETYGRLFVQTLRKPLKQVLYNDHHRISEQLKALRAITHSYAFPDTACTNHQVLFHRLRELDSDLVQHKHLENNILLPKAIAMEEALLSAVK